MKQRITEIRLRIQNNKGNLYDRINELLFYIIFMGFATYVPLATYNLIFMEDAEYYFYRLDKIYWGYNVLMVLLLVKILLQKNSFKEWCVIGILTVISRLSFEQSGEHYMVLILLGICAARNICMERLIWVDLLIRVGRIAGLMILPHISGMINHVDVMVGGRERTFFGWSHPNSMGLDFMLLILDWVLIRKKKMKWYEYLVAFGMIVFLDVTANSRTSEMIIVLLLIFAVFAWSRNKWSTYFVNTALWILLGCATLIPVVGVVLCRAAGSVKTFELFGTVGSRFIMTSDFIEKHGITLFGVPYLKSEEGLDFMFANLGLHCGILAGIMIALLIAYAIYRSQRENDQMIKIVLFVLLLFACMENAGLNLTFTYFAVILGYYIFIPEEREEMIGDKNINENQTA